MSEIVRDTIVCELVIKDYEGLRDTWDVMVESESEEEHTVICSSNKDRAEQKWLHNNMIYFYYSEFRKLGLRLDARQKEELLWFLNHLNPKITPLPAP